MKKLLYLFVGLGLLTVSCKSDDNGIDNPNEPNNPITENLDPQAFMWNAMNLWYFWQEDVDDLSDDRFSNDQEFTEFLQQHPDPSDFYFNTLLFSEDRFSFLNEDYKELVNNLSGVSKSNGVEFGLIRFSEGNGLFGYVQYIVPDSDASTTDIKRGDIFTRVDGTALTLDNYVELLFGDNDTYTLGLADINGDEITDNDTEIELTKIANQVEDPILVAETLDINGTKIAYLMYNRFLSNFNEELNAAFGEFVANGATELVLTCGIILEVP